MAVDLEHYQLSDVIAPSSTRGASRRSVRRLGYVGLGIFAVIVLLALLAPVIRPGPNTISLFDTLKPPSWAHPFGTDQDGRDMLARVLAAARIDLLIGVGGALLSFVIGSALGVLIGYAGGPFGEVSMRILDAVQAFPLLILALAMLAFLGQSTLTIIYAVAFVNVPIFIRLVRTETVSVNNLPYMEAARCVGCSRLRLVGRHLLPNVSTSALTQLTTSAGYAILLTGALSFLGVGVRPPTAEWGSLVQGGVDYLVTKQWWLTVFPGLAIVITVLSLQMMSEALVRGRRVR
jgi:peptide/nickel transport system permease protein